MKFLGQNILFIATIQLLVMISLNKMTTVLFICQVSYEMGSIKWLCFLLLIHFKIFFHGL